MRTTRSPAQRALCAHPQVCNTSTLLSLRHSLSLQLLPILPTDTFMYTHTYKHTSNCCPPFFYCRQGSLIFSREEKHVMNSAALSPGLWQGLSVMEPQIQTGSPRSGTSCCCVSCLCGNSAQMFGCILMLWCSCESWYQFSPFAR